MTTVWRAVDRYRSEQPGITSWHCFSAGAHYDPANVALGPIVGVDEHLLAPGAGFDWHAHGGVHIVSLVLEGTLRHEDSSGEVRLVGPGELLLQSTGVGIRHTETNGSSTAPLRFVQTTIVGAGEPALAMAPPPLHIGGVTIDVRHGSTSLDGGSHVLVIAGQYRADGCPLSVGDTVRVDDGDTSVIDGAGELLVAIIEGTDGERDAHS